MLTDVCRLCLKKDDLVWVFDRRLENNENLKNVILTTTGVEIDDRDMVSQKVCKNCCTITAKMYEFRTTSLANDKLLKAQYLKTLSGNIKNSVNINPNIHVKIFKPSTSSANVKKIPTPEPTFRIHPTVRKLFKSYPEIKLPTICLKSHIAPLVTLQMNEVENYFKSKNLDFKECTKIALQSGKVIKKKTSGIKLKPTTFKIARVVPVECADKTKVSPIKIIQERVNETVSQKPEVKKITEETSQTTQNVHTPPENRKRKLDQREETPEKDYTKKPLFIESLGLTPRISLYPPISESPAYVSTKSCPLHICNICNSVQYNAKDLKKHQQKHLKCQFCKMMFRTLDSKRQHIENVCFIKKTMQNLPNVKLQKIEFDIEIRKKYPRAFVGFSPLDDYTDDTSECNPDIIEIFSDDDEPILVRDVGPENVPEQVNVPTRAKKSTKSLESPKKTVASEPASILLPDIRIKGNTVFNKVDTKSSDMQILRDLVKLIPVQLNTREKKIQTELPNNDSISVNPQDSTIELKHLKRQLYMYKIPIVIKNGPLKVAYNYRLEHKASKKMCLWSDLMPIDIKAKTVMKTTSKLVAIDVNDIPSSANSIIKQTPPVKEPQQANSPTILNSSIANLMTLPSQKVTPPKFIRINKSSLIGSAKIIDTNPLLNNILNNTITTAPTATITSSASVNASIVPLTRTASTAVAPKPATTTANKPASTNNGPVGLIRVKHAWELK